MIQHVPFSTIKDALDWRGLEVTEIDENTLSVGAGRIGLTYNPLVFTQGHVDGGWYVEPAVLDVEHITRIDILMHIEEGDTYFLLRTDDPTEIYDDEYELLLSLGWRQGDTWCITVRDGDS